jgi:hypothetical protein
MSPQAAQRKYTAYSVRATPLTCVVLPQLAHAGVSGRVVVARRSSGVRGVIWKPKTYRTDGLVSIMGITNFLTIRSGRPVCSENVVRIFGSLFRVSASKSVHRKAPPRDKRLACSGHEITDCVEP